MFVDNVLLRLVAGDGGNGIVAWRREKYIPKGGPAGGDGGKGGSVILESDSHVYSLEDFRNTKTLSADKGGQGGSGQKKGKNGKDKTIKVPLGTIVKDVISGEILYDFTEDKQKLVLCKGGIGGKGNSHFKSSTNRAPNICTNGTMGEKREVELELKLLADVGLVGLPNAGKSTLISKLAKFPVKIAPYPFTTLKPNLGIVEFEDYSKIIIADIPGIIKDAHLDKGLGLSFLKHIERTEIIVFVLDISEIEDRTAFFDFQTLQQELKAYSPKMLEKPFLTVLNKIDILGSDKKVLTFKKQYPYPLNTLIEISATQELHLSVLLEKIRKLAQKNGKKF